MFEKLLFSSVGQWLGANVTYWNRLQMRYLFGVDANEATLLDWRRL